MSNVNHPGHYNAPGRKECIVEMLEKFGSEKVRTFCELNAYKYHYRHEMKNGQEDLEKAAWYEEYAKNLIVAASLSGNEYQKLAMRTNDGLCTRRLQDIIEGCDPETCDIGGIMNAALGLSGEVGEFNDMLKKWVFHETELDLGHAMKELGDIMWYVALMCHSFGWRLDDIMTINIGKLKVRYPQGFDVELANHRKEGDI